jgi:ABC-type glutathione transport system ATPase component
LFFSSVHLPNYNQVIISFLLVELFLFSLISQMCLRYRKGLPLVLHNISLSIRGGHRIGVVGKSGCGKSSLMLSLLRLVEPVAAENGDDASGDVVKVKVEQPSDEFSLAHHANVGQALISIDGVNTSSLGLSFLRRNLTVIPQDPMLYSV